MQHDVQTALARWPFKVRAVEFVAHRENAIYRVSADQGEFALRLHRPGYRSDAEFASELAYMDALAAGGISVPAPVRSSSGNYIEHAGETRASMLNWVIGRPLGQTGVPLSVPDREGTFRNFGKLIARIHDLSDNWQVPGGFVRKSWDCEGLLGEQPQWGRFWDNPMLTAEERELMLLAREKLMPELRAPGHDMGLIHADLVSENILVDGETIRVIDFDDSGFGFRAQDLATALVKHGGETDYANLRSALFEGYRTARPCDERTVELLLLMRHLSYLGWIVPRMANAGGEERCRQFIARAVPMARQYIGPEPYFTSTSRR